MAKHRKKTLLQKAFARVKGALARLAPPAQPTPAKKTTAPAAAPVPLTPFVIGRDRSLVDFIQADYAAVTEYRTKQAAALAQIKQAPLSGLKAKQELKNSALEKTIEWAAAKADETREELQKGAREAFLAGHHEKIQLILAEPGKFLPVGKTLRTKSEDDLISNTLINLLNASDDPAAALSTALKDVSEKKKQTSISRTLYVLIADYKNVKYEKVASALLQAGAKASGLSLADAVHRKLPATVVDMLIDKGASFDEARKFLDSRKSQHADRLDFIQHARTQKAIIEGLMQNVRDLTNTTEGRHRKLEEPAPVQPVKPAAPKGPS